jgi:hypothetical protein
MPYQSVLEGPIREWKGKRLLLAEFTAQPQNQECEPGLGVEGEIERRQKLLADYMAATGNPSRYRIYNARNSGIHKPQFYSWLVGNLPSDSATCINFERFLCEKKPPIPRKPRS